MPIKLKANNGNIDLKVPIKQVGGGAVDSVNGMTGDVVLDIPSKTSQLENDSGFLTSIPSEYVTETELEAKGYLTEHQSLENYSTKDYVSNALTPYAKKSEIPDVSGFLTSIPDEYVTEAELDAKGYLTQHQSLAEYAKKSELFSKDYNDLTNKPTIPSVEGLASTQYVDNKVSEIVVPSLEGYATEQWVEGKGYLTQHQSLADYATKSELATKQDTLTAGNNITIENGVISATGGSGGGSYTLPVANENTLGGVKAKQTESDKNYGVVYIDSNARLRVPIANQDASGNAGIVLPNSGQFEVDNNGYMYLRPASISIGGVKADGKTTTVDTDGTIHAVVPKPYTLPTASTTTLGGVKVDGTSITIADGVISTDLPTKISDLTNDSGFITNEYHDPTKQNTLVAGNNITIANDGTISASHPARYIDGANVSGNTLTLYYNNDTSVVFTPTGGSGGGSGGVSGYAFSSTQTLTDTDKTHLKEIYNNKNIHMTIDRLTVVRIMPFGVKRGFVVINTNGATSNQVLVYTVDIDGSGNITSNTFTLFMSYYLVGNSSVLSGDIITSENWSQYISAGGGDWVGPTTDTSMSDLYNIKQLWIIYQGMNTGAVMQSVLRFDYDSTASTLGGRANYTFYLHHDDVTSNQVYIDYDGTNLNISGGSILGYFYKT